MNEPSPLRIASQWLLGALLAVVLAFLFLAIVAVQWTAEGTGGRILRRSIAVTTQIDVLLPGIEAALHEAAEGGDDPVRVPDFPIPVELPADEARRLQGDALRQRILAEAAARLYADGMSAWAAGDPDADQGIETISTAGVYRRGLGLITDDTHTRIIIAAAVLGGIALVLAALLIAASHSYYRLVALSAATLVAALPSLAAAIAVRFGLRTAEEEADPFITGLLRIGVDSMWVPIRDYLAITSLAFAVIAVASLLLWWQARRSPPPAPSPGPGR